MCPSTPDRPSLLILAAGEGSRFGGLKQLAPAGPGGEAILDYTIEDAWRGGFGRVVVVARPEIQKRLGRHLSEYHQRITHGQASEGGRGSLALDVVVQQGDPGGSRWGTGYAVLAAADVIAAPFAVANADDFYGRESLALMAEHLADPTRAGEWAMVAFRLSHTLSPHGGVSRGICIPGPTGLLNSLREATGVARGEDGRIRDDSGSILADDTPVSMNLWGFGPEVFDLLRDLGGQHGADGQGSGAVHLAGAGEFRLPDAVESAVGRGYARIRMYRTDERWVGLTHPGDLEETRRFLRERP